MSRGKELAQNTIIIFVVLPVVYYKTIPVLQPNLRASNLKIPNISINDDITPNNITNTNAIFKILFFTLHIPP